MYERRRQRWAVDGANFVMDPEDVCDSRVVSAFRDEGRTQEECRRLLPVRLCLAIEEHNSTLSARAVCG